MRRAMFIAVLWVFSSLFTFAQSVESNKPSVAIVSCDKESDRYSNLVEEAIIQTRKFSLMERSQIDKIKTERNLQKSEDFFDGNKLKEGIFQGVKYLILYNLQYSNNIPSDLYIRIVDVNTTQIYDAKSFSLSEISNKVPVWIDKLIPTIYAVNEIKKSYMVFSAGDFDGITEGEILEVVEVKKYGNNESYEKIGEIKVIKTQGSNFSKAKIIKGKKKINKHELSTIKIKRNIIYSEKADAKNSKKNNEESKVAKPKRERNYNWIYWVGGIIASLYLLGSL